MPDIVTEPAPGVQQHCLSIPHLKLALLQDLQWILIHQLLQDVGERFGCLRESCHLYDLKKNSYSVCRSLASKCSRFLAELQASIALLAESWFDED